MKIKTLVGILAVASASLLMLSDDLDTDQIVRTKNVRKVLAVHQFFDAQTGDLIQVNSQMFTATYEITDTATNLVSVTPFPGNATRPAGDTKSRADLLSVGTVLMTNYVTRSEWFAGWHRNNWPVTQPSVP